MERPQAVCALACRAARRHAVRFAHELRSVRAQLAPAAVKERNILSPLGGGHNSVCRAGRRGYVEETER